MDNTNSIIDNNDGKQPYDNIIVDGNINNIFKSFDNKNIHVNGNNDISKSVNKNNTKAVDNKNSIVNNNKNILKLDKNTNYIVDDNEIILKSDEITDYFNDINNKFEVNTNNIIKNNNGLVKLEVEKCRNIVNNVNDLSKPTKKGLCIEKVTLSQLPSDAASVTEFYANQNILITGGTGFMGKVLIEKLLRSCPNINKIYLLMREKKGYTDEMRLNKIFNIPLFDRLKNERPESFSKVKLIKGDISEIKYGLSDNDMEFIINEINIVFHVAASVRFDNPLKEAILINTRGTRELQTILKQMKNLKVFLHTSTTYCNIDKETDVIEEKVYEATTDWKTMINAAENMDESTLNFLEKKILDKYPNTYTFAKNLGEEIVSESCEDIPTVIFRPTVVVASQKDPMPGWVDNFNGPMGLVSGVLCGVLHTVYIDSKKKLDWVPVDVAIKGMITAAWYKALEQTERKKCLVINSSTTDFIQISNSMLFEYGVAKKGMESPYSQLLWYPFSTYTAQKQLFWFYVVIFHLFPAIFFSIIFKFSKQRLDLWKLYRRIYYTNICLAPFTLNEWQFQNDNFRSLHAILKPGDIDEFSIDYTAVTVHEYFEIAQTGTALYLLKDKNFSKDTLEKRLFNLKIKFYIHILTIGIVIIGLLFAISSLIKI